MNSWVKKLIQNNCNIPFQSTWTRILLWRLKLLICRINGIRATFSRCRRRRMRFMQKWEGSTPSWTSSHSQDRDKRMIQSRKPSPKTQEQLSRFLKQSHRPLARSWQTLIVRQPRTGPNPPLPKTHLQKSLEKQKLTTCKSYKPWCANMTNKST